MGTSKDKARYLPPGASLVPQLMDELQLFIKDSGDLHPLIACGVVHHRFEAIHPFEDGNGRTGRLLISLYLIDKNILNIPILYPSGYFERNKDEYISSLAKVDKSERWYQWIMFFLLAMEHQAKVSIKTALEIDELFRESRSKIEDERANLNLIKVLEHMFVRPFITSRILSQETGIPRTTCDRYLAKLCERGVIYDRGIIRKQRVFINRGLLNILRNA